MSAHQTGAAPAKSLFDFFLSYKHMDSSDLVEAIAAELRARKYDIWLDSTETHPGDSIFKSIEDGLSNSIDAIVVLSANYFTGWAEHERQSIVSLMDANKIRIVPLWYHLNREDVQRHAPELAGIIAVPVSDTTPRTIEQTCDIVAQTFHPRQRRDRLYELFFRCVHKNFPDDQDIAVFLAVYNNDTQALQTALDKGGNPNITEAALWNRYSKTALEGCFPEWRKLFLYLTETGAIGANDAK
jgi:hypothetical protein